MRTRYFEVSRHGRDPKAYEDKYADDITVAEINERLSDGLAVRELSKEEYNTWRQQ